MIRMLTAAAAAVATAGAGAAVALMPAHAAPTKAPVTTVAAAPASVSQPTVAQAHAPKWPWMSVSMRHSMKGRTLTYRYADTGYQYLVKDDGAPYANRESAGFRINFGDGTPVDGGDGLGGASCLKSGKLARFQGGPGAWQTHRYARPGRYTVTVTGSYCGMGKNPHVTHTYTVIAR